MGSHVQETIKKYRGSQQTTEIKIWKHLPDPDAGCPAKISQKIEQQQDNLPTSSVPTI
jgi:hypothetical protein